MFVLGTRLKGHAFLMVDHGGTSATPNHESSFKGLCSCHVCNVPLAKSSHVAKHRIDGAREGERWEQTVIHYHRYCLLEIEKVQKDLKFNTEIKISPKMIIILCKHEIPVPTPSLRVWEAYMGTPQ